MKVQNNFLGILPVYKPQGFTSFDVVAKLRGILKMRRIGHSGTLDPMATGVLPILLGGATRACDIIPDDKKAYVAKFALGITTDTQDITGKIISKSDNFITFDEVSSVIAKFKGEQDQLPPMFSAVSVKGQRLYDLARKGLTVERKSKKITVHNICLNEYSPEERIGEISLTVSRGAYIRTIIHDMGQAIGCGATMTSLIRTMSSGITLDECLSFEQISQFTENNRLEEKIIPVERLFDKLYRITLDQKQTQMYKNGVKLDLSRIESSPEHSCRCAVYGTNGFIGIGFADANICELRIEKNFAG